MAESIYLRRLSPYEQFCFGMNIGLALRLKAASSLSAELLQQALELSAQEHPYLRMAMNEREGTLWYNDRQSVPRIQV